MKLSIVPDYDALSQHAADAVCQVVRAKPDAVLLLATGRTPLGLFAELVRRWQQGRVSFDKVRLVELDEYAGLPMTDERNLFNWLQREFISQTDVRVENAIRFDSATPDPVQEVWRVITQLSLLDTIDLAVLGLGLNGHIGFNEPFTNLNALGQVVELAPTSIASGAEYWGDESRVPRQGMTLAFGTLNRARQTLLLVSGDHKATILARTLSSDLNDAIPATWLRRQADVTVIADVTAASRIRIE